MESLNTVTGQQGILAILPNAAAQGRTAGINMTGGDATFNGGIPMNSMGILGLHLMTAGSYYEAEEGGQVYFEQTENAYKKLFVKDDRLTGFILMGDLHRTGIYTALIREGTPLNTIDFEAVKKDPSLLPFGENYRRQKLGGVV